MLGDVVIASIFSVIFIGLCAIVGGVFEIIHAFWTKGWGWFHPWEICSGFSTSPRA